MLFQTLHKVLAGDIVGESCQSFYVLSGSHLQRWTMTGDIEKLEYQMEVERMLQESLAEAIWVCLKFRACDYQG